MVNFIFLLVAGVVSGLLASIAGLASLVSYPALLLVGVPPVLANVTNTTSLIFSGIGSIVGSLPELKGHWKQVALYMLYCVIGSIGGTSLLLLAPASTFEKVVPFFILFAGVMLFYTNRHPHQHPDNPTGKVQVSTWKKVLSVLGMVLVAAYGGYFGAAAGVLLLAILSVITDYSFPVVNSIKNVMAFTANLVATIIFIFTTRIDWLLVLPLGMGLLIGGFTGPKIVRHANIYVLRMLIAIAAFGLAADLFYKAYF